MKSVVWTAAFLLLWLAIDNASAADQWAQPPGKETPDVAQLIDEAAAKMKTREQLEAVLADAKYMPLHPYPRFRNAVERNAPVGGIEYVGPAEPGERMTVRLRLTDAAGEPVAAAVVYAYQTSAKGFYAQDAAHVQANAGDVNHARLFGYVITDDDGWIELRTIRPAGYPNSDLPQHIHLHTEHEGRSLDGNELVFTDDPRLTKDVREEYEGHRAIVATPRKQDGRWLVEAKWVIQ